VNDRMAARLTRAVYDQLTGGGAGPTGADDAPPVPPPLAAALHEAVSALRRRLPDHPSAWAAYLHMGV
jgi:hypothetical protein